MHAVSASTMIADCLFVAQGQMSQLVEKSLLSDLEIKRWPTDQGSDDHIEKRKRVPNLNAYRSRRYFLSADLLSRSTLKAPQTCAVRRDDVYTNEYLRPSMSNSPGMSGRTGPIVESTASASRRRPWSSTIRFTFRCRIARSMGRRAGRRSEW
jgi:hypothetical protein